jgi:hypothetical protein
MKENLIKNKKILVILVIVSVLLIGGIVLRIKNSGQKKVEQKTKKEEVLPESEVLPTVDSSVLVDLTSKDGKEAILTIEDIPSGTSTIEYELSYLASGNLPKGVMGEIEVGDRLKVERKITLGTCSSGSCVYDQGVTSIKANLKFNGDYGSQLFEKEFEI